jgi:hypothetical protein
MTQTILVILSLLKSKKMIAQLNLWRSHLFVQKIGVRKDMGVIGVFGI